MATSERFALLNGQRLHWTDSGGSGPVVLLSHGFLMDHTMFDPQVAALAPEFRVITWDERGFGATEFDGKPFDYWDSARDAFALLDHLGVDRAVVGGMSQGGFLSLRMALLAPERIRGLVLIDTQAGAEDPTQAETYRDMLEAWATVGPGEGLAGVVAQLIIGDPELEAVWIARWQQADPALIVEPGRCLLEREDISGRLAEITCPALVIHGDEDSAIEMPAAQALAAGLVGAGEVFVVEGAAHAANLTHPERVNFALLHFLNHL